MDINTAPREELVRLVFELMDHITALEAENAHLREQLQQRGKGSSTTKPALLVKPNIPKKKPHQRKQRTHSYTRKTEIPTERIFHTASSCHTCGGVLGKPTV